MSLHIFNNRTIYLFQSHNQYKQSKHLLQLDRLIVEVKNPTDTAITDYFQQKNYETEGNNLDAGRTT